MKKNTTIKKSSLCKKIPLFPILHNTRLVLLQPQILLGISCFQHEACQDRAINPKGSALLSSVLHISTPGNRPMMCSLSSQVRFTPLVVPLSVLCILCIFNYLFSSQIVFGTERSDGEGVHLYSSPKVFFLSELYHPSSLHFPDAVSHRAVLGFLTAGWYCIRLCSSCLLPLASCTLTNFCFLVKAYQKAIAIPCPCDLNVWLLFFPQLKCSPHALLTSPIPACALNTQAFNSTFSTNLYASQPIYLV